MDFTDETHPAVVKLDDWLGGLRPFSREIELGRIDALFDRAAQGLLVDPGDATRQIDAIRTDPDLYELRLTSLKCKLRFYHAEPPPYPQHLYGLHRHIKYDKPDQDMQIQHAVDVYRRAMGDNN